MTLNERDLPSVTCYASNYPVVLFLQRRRVTTTTTTRNSDGTVTIRFVPFRCRRVCRMATECRVSSVESGKRTTLHRHRSAFRGPERRIPSINSIVRLLLLEPQCCFRTSTTGRKIISMGRNWRKCFGAQQRKITLSTFRRVVGLVKVSNHALLSRLSHI